MITQSHDHFHDPTGLMRRQLISLLDSRVTGFVWVLPSVLWSNLFHDPVWELPSDSHCEMAGAAKEA